jgi:dihydroorotate dehydrogenase (NAD+) catalytic subunit
VTTPDLTTRLGRLELTSPVLVASGCGGSGRELQPYADLAALGAFTTASITLEPRRGRRAPRVAETPAGLLGSLGLPGPGVDVFLARELPWLAEHCGRVIVSIAGGSLPEYAELARRIGTAEGVAAVEVNLSSPDGWDRADATARDGYSAQRVLAAVRQEVPQPTPVLAKISADVGNVTEVAAAAARGGADGVTLVNALPGMAMDPVTLRPALGGVTGALSGPAVHPVAVHAVYQAHAELPDLPIVGTGGVRTGWDALELVLAGASAVGVGSALLRDPAAADRITTELTALLAEHALPSLAAAVGLGHRTRPSVTESETA